MRNRPTPETDDLDCKLHNPRVLQDRYSEMMEHAQNMERERDDYKWQLHIAKGEIAEARKMERAWKLEETK